MLWIVATPIGNLGDISRRALEILARVDVVLAEDTRRTGMLFSRLGLASPRFLSFFEHNEEDRVGQALDLLGQGLELALVSDAGTPLLADPGYRLVRACRERGVPVSPLPGPSAILAALSASGLPPYPFLFLGFPPRKRGEKAALFAPLATLAATLVFFERGSRLADTLAAARETLGPRECCLARELTKLHEAFILTNLDDWLAAPQDLPGEITVVLGPPAVAEGRADEAEVDALLDAALATGMGVKDAARHVRDQARDRARGWTAKELYDRARTRAHG